MERKVGEVFDFNGIKLRVQDADYKASCNGCYFNGSICTNNKINSINQTGGCFRSCRADGKNVIFVEVKDNEK